MLTSITFVYLLLPLVYWAELHMCLYITCLLNWTPHVLVSYLHALDITCLLLNSTCSFGWGGSRLARQMRSKGYAFNVYQALFSSLVGSTGYKARSDLSTGLPTWLPSAIGRGMISVTCTAYVDLAPFPRNSGSVCTAYGATMHVGSQPQKERMHIDGGLCARLLKVKNCNT